MLSKARAHRLLNEFEVTRSNVVKAKESLKQSLSIADVRTNMIYTHNGASCVVMELSSRGPHDFDDGFST